jgi:hypothetical protein
MDALKPAKSQLRPMPQVIAAREERGEKVMGGEKSRRSIFYFLCLPLSITL